MRTLAIATLVVTAGIGAATAAAAPTKINLQGVLRETPGGPIYLHVTAGDIDGDGIADEAYLRVVCADGVVRQAALSVKAPRDSASGMASGKRTHHPVTFVKEWGPSTPQLRAMQVTYDLKKSTGEKTMSEDSWHQVTLANADGLCPAAEAAVGTVSKSRSNIQNN